MATLEFDSLYLAFGTHRILSSIYVKCTTGQVVGLLGRNGSGKSCLMQIVFGNLSAESKSVRYNGTSLMGNYMSKKTIAYLPQFDLLPSFITFEQALKFYSVDKNKIKAGFPELLEVLKRKSSEVSGGQRRLFEVLLILHSQHPFCLLDEPFSGLMPVTIDRLKELILEERKNKGIIITDHLHRQIRTIADELYVLTNGTTYQIKNDEQLIEYGYLSEL
ncbi:MAG: ATP-binding cassette domain-containing protein [Flammeovirgaceae bacterium]|nr:ATP-binding cassette domain-containing protein [Flammeovirgaceae bacterium]